MAVQPHTHEPSPQGQKLLRRSLQFGRLLRANGIKDRVAGFGRLLEEF